MSCPICGGEGKHQRQCRLNSRRDVSLETKKKEIQKQKLARIRSKQKLRETYTKS